MTSHQPDTQAARASLVQAMRRMHASGLNRGTSGNASVRASGGMIVTPSGIAPDALTPEAMVFVAEDGRADPDALRPSTEHLMHLHILLARPDAQAVVHCHSRHATILACCGRPIEPLHYMVLVAGAARIGIAPYATFGTQALASHVVTTMGGGRACLMANHGQVAIGRSLAEALAIAEEVEEQAAITYGALLIGGGQMLSAAELDATVERFRGYGQQEGKTSSLKEEAKPFASAVADQQETTMQDTEALARAHGVSSEAVRVLQDAVRRGGGRMAQFSHPELGGMGQWSAGGMTQIGAMSDTGLRDRVAALCAAVAASPKDPASAEAGPTRADRDWWPDNLGQPSATGGQDGIKYACFPTARRVAIEQGGHVTVYDSGQHRISGVAQSQGGTQELVFSSQLGDVRAQDLPVA